MVYFQAVAATSGLFGLAPRPSIHVPHSSRSGSWWTLIGCRGLTVLMWTAEQAEWPGGRSLLLYCVTVLSEDLFMGKKAVQFPFFFKLFVLFSSKQCNRLFGAMTGRQNPGNILICGAQSIAVYSVKVLSLHVSNLIFIFSKLEGIITPYNLFTFFSNSKYFIEKRTMQLLYYINNQNACYSKSRADNAQPNCFIARKSSVTQQVLFEQWNDESSIFAHNTLAFLSLRCADITVLFKRKEREIIGYLIGHEKQVVNGYQNRLEKNPYPACLIMSVDVQMQLYKRLRYWQAYS